MNDSDQLLTVREVSIYLRVARSTVYRLAQDGRLPGRKVGGTWRFSRRSLDDWLLNQSTDLGTPHPETSLAAPLLPPAA